jgi:hypothetical protein
MTGKMGRQPTNLPISPWMDGWTDQSKNRPTTNLSLCVGEGRNQLLCNGTEEDAGGKMLEGVGEKHARGRGRQHRISGGEVCLTVRQEAVRRNACAS